MAQEIKSYKCCFCSHIQTKDFKICPACGKDTFGKEYFKQEWYKDEQVIDEVHKKMIDMVNNQ